jgi:hypothetical protein
MGKSGGSGRSGGGRTSLTWSFAPPIGLEPVDGTDGPLVAALETAAGLLGGRLEPFLDPGPGERANASDFTRLATVHTFRDA